MFSSPKKVSNKSDNFRLILKNTCYYTLTKGQNLFSENAKLTILVKKLTRIQYPYLDQGLNSEYEQLSNTTF
jgi:hypothetical protein